jgi:uncharacterized protein YkwD
MPRLLPALVLGLVACGSSRTDERPLTPPPSPRVAQAAGESPEVPPPTAVSGTSTGDPAAAPKRKLTVDEARRYMVELINRDRKSMGLAPVELDEGAATRAGQAHAEDMAKTGYLGHWGSDGSVPEQRLTEAGGADMVLENALCFVDEKGRTLDPKPLIEPSEIVRAEHLFFDETPPNDGHRKNILKSAHRKVGIGIAQPIATATELPVPCFSQEFTDPYGTYAAIPRSAKVGATIHLEGEIHAPATMGGVGIARLDPPRPLSVADLNKRRSYPVPAPYQMYWPAGFKTPIPVKVHGGKFSIDVPLNDRGQPGLYEVSVWGKTPSSPEYAILGLRTVLVER